MGGMNRNAGVIALRSQPRSAATWAPMRAARLGLGEVEVQPPLPQMVA